MERIRRLFQRGKGAQSNEMELRERMKNHEYRATEHNATLEELAAELGTSLNFDEPKDSAGLPSVVVASRLVEEGRNILSPPKKTPEWVKFLLHFTDFFMLLLLVAATLSCIVYGLDPTQLSSLVVGIFLYVVVVIDVGISYAQERASSNVMQTFSKMLPQSCKVVRDGFEREVGADELVRGDIVKFAIGDKIPADMRIIFNQQAKVECSSITGESTPISLTAEKTHDRPTETRNLVFNGSLCLNGEAYGVVIRTGDHTLIGQIASLAGAQSSKPTTLQLEIQYFVKFIALISTCTAIIFFIVGMARGQSFLSTFVNGFIVVILAFLPCGLPTAVTSIISICAKKMAKKNVYVKKLDIVETLGSTSLIASDKTGTLTQNVMTVVSFWCNNEFINVNNTNGTNSMLLVDLMEDPSFKLILQCASLCNRARFSDEGSSAPASTVTTEHDPSEHHEDQKITINQLPRRASFAPSIAPSEYPETIKERTVLGDASDAAIFRFVNQLGIAERLRRQYPKVFEIPFNSTIKHSIAIVNDPIADDSGVHRHHLMFIKGAPEIILSKCGRFYQKGQIKDVNEDFTNSVTTALKRSGAAGERVLAFAMASIDNPPESYTEDPPNYPTEGIVFLGLVSLVDPPRPNVPEAIKQLKKAHIKVLMVTGDHPITAEAIARKVNIIGDGKTRVEVAKSKGLNLEDVALSDKEVQAVVVSGSELNTFTEEQWRVVLSKKEIVFARTTPTQKLEIVERNQALGYVVAVTGDGVNDSPALKAADVGVAMGKMGSDVAREAADIVLITDDFASILDAVKMGRLIFDNLKKTIAYTLPHVIPELVPVLCTLTFSFPLALNSILILCIDLGTEMFPSVSLAYEKAESNIMTRPPRNTKKDKMASYQILNYSYILAGIPEAAACFFAFLFVFLQHGIPLSYLPNSSATNWQIGSQNMTVGNVTFNDEQQVKILNEAGTTYFLTLVLCQFWHIWFARTSRASTFRRRPRNLVMIMGCIISLCLTAIIVYVPGLQSILGSENVIGINYTMNLTFLVYIALLSETIKYFGRTYKKGFAAKHLVY